MQQIAVHPYANRLLAAAGIVVAVPAAVVATSGDREPSNSTIPVALTSNVDLSDAAAFLYNPDSHGVINRLPDGTFPSAYGSLTTVYSDAHDAFQSPADAAALNWDELAGLAGIGQLTGGAVINDTTATQLFSSTVNEANTETASLQHLAAVAAADAPGFGTEQGVASDLLTFQQDINGSLNALNTALDPATLSGYDSNGFLDAMLHGVLVSELNLDALSGTAAGDVAGGNDIDLAATAAAMITNALGEYGYMQGILGFFSVENTLDDISGWFAPLS